MKCENCGNENVEIINARKGHYLCGKCGRDTEALYEMEHDKEIRAKAIEEFAEKLKIEIYDQINDISERQSNYEAGSDMSLTYSHMMGTLRDMIVIVSDTEVKLKGE